MRNIKYKFPINPLTIDYKKIEKIIHYINLMDGEVNNGAKKQMNIISVKKAYIETIEVFHSHMVCLLSEINE